MIIKFGFSKGKFLEYYNNHKLLQLMYEKSDKNIKSKEVKSYTKIFNITNLDSFRCVINIRYISTSAT